MTSPGTEPPGSKPIAVFALQACVLALLIGWWPTPRALYPPLVRTHIGALLSTAADGAVTLRPSDGKTEGVDTLMQEMRAGERAPRWRAELPLLRLGWWPSAVLGALLLATPMASRRRALALCAGFLWIQAYVLLRLFAEVRYADVELSAKGDSAVGPLQALLRSGAEVLEANLVLIAIVLLAWVVLGQPGRVLDTRSLRRLLPAART